MSSLIRKMVGGGMADTARLALPGSQPGVNPSQVPAIPALPDGTAEGRRRRGRRGVGGAAANTVLTNA